MRCATKIQATNVRTHCRAETIRTPKNQCKAHVVQTQSTGVLEYSKKVKIRVDLCIINIP